MQVKFRLSEKTWNEFLELTSTPSETLREMVNTYIHSSSLDHVIGVNEAAELWDPSPGYIKNLCASGKVKAKHIGKTWVIDSKQPNPSKSSN